MKLLLEIPVDSFSTPIGHKLINAALAEEMKEIHALSIKKAITPEQHLQQQQQA